MQVAIGRGLDVGEPAPPAGVHRHILLPAHGIADRPGDRHGLDVGLPELVPVLGAIDRQRPPDSALDQQAARRGENPTRPVARIGHTPDFLSLHRIPGGQPGLLVGVRIGRLLPAQGVVAEIGRARAAPVEPGGSREGHEALRHREIDQAGLRAIGHRVEVVGPAGAR